MNFIGARFDLIFLLFFFGTYIYLTIFKNSKAMFKLLFLCILWATSAIWIEIIPNHGYLFSDNTPFPGAIIPVGGLIYGVPLTIASLITWSIKRKMEKKKE